jgi:hypothetical protein
VTFLEAPRLVIRLRKALIARRGAPTTSTPSPNQLYTTVLGMASRWWSTSTHTPSPLATFSPAMKVSPFGDHLEGREKARLRTDTPRRIIHK